MDLVCVWRRQEYPSDGQDRSEIEQIIIPGLQGRRRGSHFHFVIYVTSSVKHSRFQRPKDVLFAGMVLYFQ